MASVFETLNATNVSGHTEPKGNLTYLSWVWAWAEVKKAFPNANYKIYENEQGWFYFTDGRTCWVKTGVIIEGIEHIEFLPVMDNRNNSIPYEKVTSTDVNKAIQRSITKACARHGLGLYVYAGEDLPEVEQEEENARAAEEEKQKEEAEAKKKAELLEKQNGVIELLSKRKIPVEFVLKLYKVSDVKELTLQKCDNIVSHIDDIKKKMEDKE